MNRHILRIRPKSQMHMPASMIAGMVHVAPLFEKLDQLWLEFSDAPPDRRNALRLEIDRVERHIRLLERRHHN